MLLVDVDLHHLQLHVCVGGDAGGGGVQVHELNQLQLDKLVEWGGGGGGGRGLKVW